MAIHSTSERPSLPPGCHLQWQTRVRHRESCYYPTDLASAFHQRPGPLSNADAWVCACCSGINALIISIVKRSSGVDTGRRKKEDGTNMQCAIGLLYHYAFHFVFRVTGKCSGCGAKRMTYNLCRVTNNNLFLYATPRKYEREHGMHNKLLMML